MCLFTQTLYACGHPRYVLKTSCPLYYHNTITNSPSCVLITNPAGCPPITCIAETIAYPRFSCGVEGCGYTLASDPFLDEGAEVRPFPGSVGVGSEVWKVVEDVQMEGGEGMGEVRVGEFYRKSARLGKGGKGGKGGGSWLKSVKGAGVRKVRKQRGGKKGGKGGKVRA